MTTQSLAQSLIDNPPFHDWGDEWTGGKIGFECSCCKVTAVIRKYDSEYEAYEAIKNHNNHTPTCPYRLAVESQQEQEITPERLEALGFTREYGSGDYIKKLVDRQGYWINITAYIHMLGGWRFIIGDDGFSPQNINTMRGLELLLNLIDNNNSPYSP